VPAISSLSVTNMTTTANVTMIAYSQIIRLV